MAKRPLLETDTPRVDPTDEALNRVLDEAQAGVTFEETPVEAAEVVKETGGTPAPEATPAEVDQDQLRQALQHRVTAAEQARREAIQMQKDGARLEIQYGSEVLAARAAMHKHFPPMTAAENIRQHLAAENAQRVARVEVQKARGVTNPAASHLDAIRNPSRGSVNRGYGAGRSAGTYNRTQASKMGGVVPGSAAALDLAARQEAAKFTPGTR